MADLFINDGGDARLEDENGDVVARFDESAGEWQLNATDVQGVGALDAQSVSTDSLSFGISSRPITNFEQETWSVPGDYNTIQAALNDLPLWIRYPIVIDVADGTYSEHLVVPPFIASYIWDDGSTGGTETIPLIISGNATTPSNVVIESIVTNGAVGGQTVVQVFGLHARNSIQIGDELAAFGAFGTFEAEFGNVGITDAGNTITNAVMSNGSNVSIGNIDVGADLVSYVGHTKHNGQIIVQQGSTVSGSTTNHVWVESGGGYIASPDVAATGANGFADDAPRFGHIYNYGTGTVYWPVSAGTTTFGNQVSFDEEILADPGNVSPTIDPTTESPDRSVVVEIDGSVYELPAYLR